MNCNKLLELISSTLRLSIPNCSEVKVHLWIWMFLLDSRIFFRVDHQLHFCGSHKLDDSASDYRCFGESFVVRRGCQRLQRGWRGIKEKSVSYSHALSQTDSHLLLPLPQTDSHFLPWILFFFFSPQLDPFFFWFLTTIHCSSSSVQVQTMMVAWFLVPKSFTVVFASAEFFIPVPTPLGFPSILWNYQNAVSTLIHSSSNSRGVQTSFDFAWGKL